MYEYWADLRFLTPIDECFGVIRDNDGVLEEYSVRDDIWEFSPRLADMFIGELETERISEKKAYEIIERLKRDYEKKRG